MTRKKPPGTLLPRGGARPGSGAKPHPIDLETVRNVAMIGGTHEEIAAVIGMNYRAYEARLGKEPAIREAYESGRDKGRVTLRRQQWHGAMNGNPTMLIWLGKQMLGQRDQAVLEVKEDGERTALLAKIHNLLSPAQPAAAVTIDQPAALPVPAKDE